MAELDRKTRWRTVAPWGILGCAYGVSVTITPFFYDALGLDADTIGWMTGAQGVGVIACAGLARGLVARLGAARAFAVSVLAYAGLVTVFGHLEQAWALALARWCDGALGVAAIVAVEIALTADPAASRARNLGTMAAVGALGLGLGAVLARTLWGHLPFTILFATAGLIALVAMASGWFWLPATSGRFEPQEVGEAPTGASPTSQVTLLRRSWHASAAALVYGAFQTTWVVLVPLVVVQVTPLGVEDALWLPALHVLGVFMLTPTLLRLSAGRRGLWSLCALCAASIAALAAAPLPWIILIEVWLIGGATAAAQARTLTELITIAPAHEPGRANSLNASLGAVGKIIGPIALGALMARAGSIALLLALAAMWAIAAATTFAYPLLAASTSQERS